MDNSQIFVMRTYRWLVLASGGGATAASAVVLVRVIQISGFPWAFEGVALLAAVLVVWLNYWAFHRVELDRATLRKKSWFGLKVIDVPLAGIHCVSLGGERRARGSPVPTFVVEWDGRRMPFYFDRYPMKVLFEFAEKLKEYGVPLTKDVEDAIRDPEQNLARAFDRG